jgi:hypothetical protein
VGYGEGSARVWWCAGDGGGEVARWWRAGDEREESMALGLGWAHVEMYQEFGGYLIFFDILMKCQYSNANFTNVLTIFTNALIYLP